MSQDEQESNQRKNSSNPIPPCRATPDDEVLWSKDGCAQGCASGAGYILIIFILINLARLLG